jgi:hypothetical protein
MRSAAQLWDLYDEWKRLTEKEGAAILASNWAEVRRCQRAKTQLQGRIVQFTDVLKTKGESPSDQTELNSHIRVRVNELIRLENENQSALSRRMAELHSQRSALDETSTRLGKLRKSYVPAPHPIWNQYS